MYLGTKRPTGLNPEEMSLGALLPSSEVPEFPERRYYKYMPAYPKLAPDQILRASQNLPEWSVVDGKLHREYKFESFIQAFSFMSAAALESEKMDHHPDWSNVYNRVTVDLITHDAGGLTEADFRLATAFERLAKKLQ